MNSDRNVGNEFRPYGNVGTTKRDWSKGSNLEDYESVAEDDENVLTSPPGKRKTQDSRS